MKKKLLTVALAATLLLPSALQAEDALPGDGTLRFYRLAIPVTVSAFENDLQGDYGLFDDDYQDKVIPFWQACEDFVNEMFVPLGMCFDVVMDKRLVMTEHINAIDKSEDLPEIGNCTNYINDAIGEGSYDVGMWVTHRKSYAENSGLSVEGGAYISSAKGSGMPRPTSGWWPTNLAICLAHRIPLRARAV
ncbi:MAG: hypothetical protein UHK44_03100 [Bacteroidaceae bacterium]|nr:hypothetical protein [Bacteroidaceae bacterium]